MVHRSGSGGSLASAPPDRRARVVPVALGALVSGLVAHALLAPRAAAQEDRTAELQRQLQAKQAELEGLRVAQERVLRAKQAEVDGLRTELDVIRDLSIEQARRFDADRRRWSERLAALEAGAAPDAPRITARFHETPLERAGVTLGEGARAPVALEGVADGVTVTLNLRDARLPLALDLVCDNAYGQDGQPVALRWRRAGERVGIEPVR